MTLIATAVGALVALLPKALLRDRPEKPNPVQIPAESEIARLTRSHARLVNHIESLEREILLEQHLCTHWKEAAQRLAKQSREEREEREQRQHVLHGDTAFAHAQQNAILAQQTQAQQAQLAAYAGYCNCVPSRAQVWSEEQRRNLAAVGDRIRP